MNFADGFWFGLGFAVSLLAIYVPIFWCGQLYHWLSKKLRVTPEVLHAMVMAAEARSSPPSTPT